MGICSSQNLANISYDLLNYEEKEDLHNFLCRRIRRLCENEPAFYPYPLPYLYKEHTDYDIKTYNIMKGYNILNIPSTIIHGICKESIKTPYIYDNGKVLMVQTPLDP